MECMSAYPQPLHILIYFLVKYDTKKQTSLRVRGLIILFHSHRAESPGRFQGVLIRSNPFAEKDISCLGPVKHFEHDRTSWFTGGSELVQTCMGSSMWTQHHMHWFLHLCGHNPLIPTLHSCGMRFWGRKDLGDQMTEPAMWQKRDAQELTNSRSANMSILKKNKKQQLMYNRTSYILHDV